MEFGSIHIISGFEPIGRIGGFIVDRPNRKEQDTATEVHAIASDKPNPDAKVYANFNLQRWAVVVPDIHETPSLVGQSASI